MKQSRYNYFKQYGDFCLAVNGRSEKALLIDTKIHPQARNWGSDKPGDSGNLLARENVNSPLLSELQEKLAEHGFLIPDEMNEIEVLKERLQRHKADRSVLNIHLNPTMDCNFKCWYCYEGHQELSAMSEETQDRILSYIRKQIRTHEVQGVHISYFGGEPFLQYEQVIRPFNQKLLDLCGLYDVVCTCSATTNGYLLHAFCEDLRRQDQAEIRMWKSLQITLDGNEEHHNEIRKLKKDDAVTYHRIIMHVLQILSLKSLDVHLRINYSNASVQGLFEILEDIPERLRARLGVSLHRIWQTHHENEKLGAEEVYETLKSQGFKMDVHRLVLGKREVCYADRETQLLINYDASVYKCTARDFALENRLGYLDKNGKLISQDSRWKERKKCAIWEVSRCVRCHLLPICLGACSQMLFEYENPEKIPCVVENKKVETDLFMDQVLTRMIENMANMANH